MSDQWTGTDRPAGCSPGDVLDGRYQLTAVLGRGGMATVWSAHDRVLARDVAVKVFNHRSGAVPDENSMARATDEVRILAALSHPNVVAVYDASGATADHFDHLVMELVHGRSLRERLDGGPLTTGETARLGAEIAAGLDCVHGRGVVHRDLKPANVLLEETSRGNRAKLADFGVARLLEGTPLTTVGTTVGTANYLSPEQATGVDVGPASDVYSLGLVLIEALTGRMAYPGHGVGAAAARLHRAPVLPADLDPRWQSLLRGMTALDPSRRPDAAAVAARLDALAAAAAGDTRAMTARTAIMGSVRPGRDTALLPATPPPRRSRRGPLLAALFVAGALIVLGIAVLVLTDDGGTATPTAPRSTSPVARTSAAATHRASPTATRRTSSTARSSKASPSATATRTQARVVQASSKPPGQAKKTAKGPGASKPAGPGGAGGPGGGPGGNGGPGGAKKP